MSFFSKSNKDTPAAAANPVTIGRNDPCHCRSGKKYKKCCEAKDEARESSTLRKKWTEAESAFAKQKEKEAEEAKKAPEPSAHLPIKPAASTPSPSQKHTTFVTPKYNMPRKSGGG